MVNIELISVVVPVYNAEKYIANTVCALRAQSYKNFEVIFVNDGSTDNTEAICNELIQNDTRFYIYTKKNSGPSSSRNYGIEHAKGAYLTFIDADDYIYPDYLSYLYGLIKKYDAEIANCEYCKLLDTQKPPEFSGVVQEKVFDSTEALQNMYCKRFLTGYPYLKLIKKEVIGDIRFPEDIIYAEDIVFVDKVLKNSKRIVYGDRILYLYYQHASSITHKVDVEQLWKSWQYHIEYFEKNTKMQMPQLAEAIECKQFVMALDLCCRVWKYDLGFRNSLLDYIKKIDAKVLYNKESKQLHRILAFLSCINTKSAIQLCRLYKKIQTIFKVQRKKAV